MFRVINEYMIKVHLRSDKEIYDRLNMYLSSCEDIDYYTVTVNHNIYVVDIKVENFMLELAEKLFGDFNKGVSYPYSSLYLRFNEGKCVRYRYITSQENKDAFYCDIIIS